MPPEDRIDIQARVRFQGHTTPELARPVVAQQSLVRLRGEILEMTTLIADVIGATGAIETLSPAETVAHFHEYSTAVQQAVLGSGGFTGKFMGETMAFRGPPLAPAGHASAACEAALGIPGIVRSLSARWVRDGKPPMRVGTDVNTGDALIGNSGSPRQLSDTAGYIGDPFATRKLGRIGVKGWSGPVSVFELVAPEDG